jgi:O-antigen ligase
MLAVLGSLPIVMSLRKQRGTKRILALVVGIALMLSVQFALLGILQRLENDPLDDNRWQFAQITREAATAYAPLGSGLGTFRQAYQPFEAKHSPSPAIVNHAHDDYLELWLEGGIPALILLGLGGSAWIWRGMQLWWLRKGDSRELADPSRSLARVAWLSATLPLIHSMLDYPLRTTANLSVFAVLAAIAFCEPARTRRAP